MAIRVYCCRFHGSGSGHLSDMGYCRPCRSPRGLPAATCFRDGNAEECCPAYPSLPTAPSFLCGVFHFVFISCHRPGIHGKFCTELPLAIQKYQQKPASHIPVVSRAVWHIPVGRPWRSALIMNGKIRESEQVLRPITAYGRKFWVFFRNKNVPFPGPAARVSCRQDLFADFPLGSPVFIKKGTDQRRAPPDRYAP